MCLRVLSLVLTALSFGLLPCLASAAPLLSVGSVLSSQLPAALQQAEEISQAGDYPGAEAEVRAFLEQVPDSAVGYDLLAQLLLTQDRIEEAEEAAKTSIALAPVGIENRIILASVFVAKGWYAEAEATLAEAVQIDPRNINARGAYAELAVNQGDLNEAAARYMALIDGGLVSTVQVTPVLRRAVDVLAAAGNHSAVAMVLSPLAENLNTLSSPQAAQVFLRLMQAHLTLNDVRSADMAVLNAVSSVPADQASALLHTAVDVYFAADKQDESIALLQDALGATEWDEQNQLAVMLLLAETQAAAGDASGGLDTVNALDTQSPQVLATRATLHWANKDADSAVADLESVVARLPRAVPLWMQLYDYWHRIEGHDTVHTQSRALLNRALEANPGDQTLLTALAELDWEEDNAAAAIASHKTILDQAPDTLDSVARVGRWYAMQPDGTEKAQSIIGAASPNNPAALQVRTVLDVEAQQFQRAKEILAVLRQRVPSNPGITLDLARSELGLGNIEIAVRLVTRALQIGLYAEDGRKARQILSEAEGNDQTTFDVFAISDDGQGDRFGEVTFSDTLDGLRVSPALTGLPPGTLGFHVHAHGSCDPAMMEGMPKGTRVAGMTAGMHFDVDLRLPPAMMEGRHPLGDLPYLKAKDDGTADQPVTAPQLRLSWIRGKAVMIHAGPDGPFGDSAPRIACGIIPEN